MLTNSKAFSGFAVDDLDAARAFYGDTLGLKVEPMEGAPMMTLHPAGNVLSVLQQ
jgi:catechol 2,3-dioxygenase-like lactoylglutathione lyase family enzyme